MKQTNENNRVLAQAWKDYDPDCVKIREDRLEVIELVKSDLEVECHEMEALSGKTLKESIEFLLALNSINYQFWDVKEGVFTRYTHEGKVGALASFAGFCNLYKELKDNFVEGIRIDEETIRRHFGSIPDIKGRVEILNEVFSSDRMRRAVEVVQKALEKGVVNVECAIEVSQILPRAYEDEYFKKIQLSLYEVVVLCQARGMQVECELTVAADYQIPKVLEGKGWIEYSEDLIKKIEAMELIESGSKEERALRAATILACQIISQRHGVSIPALDRMLWLARNEYKNKPFHLTKTSKY